MERLITLEIEELEARIAPAVCDVLENLAASAPEAAADAITNCAAPRAGCGPAAEACH